MMQKKVNPQWLPKLRGECDLSSPQERLSYKLLQREEMNAKKSRVESLLLQQYTAKYGSKAPASKINTYIKNAVKNLLQESDDAQVSDKMLESLEADIREYSEKIKNDILSQTLATSTTSGKPKKSDQSGSGTTNYSGLSTVSSNSESDSRARTARTAAGNKAPESHDIDPNQWSVVSAILALTDEEQSIREYKNMVSRKNNFKDG